MKEKVLILGAGIQGVCCALALSNKNYDVILIDKTPEPLLRSGLRNEGKIHLGFIYANDPVRRTASLMLRSALEFAPLIEKFCNRKIDWKPLRSRNFNYLILKETIVEPEKLLKHYEHLQEEYLSIKDPSLHYLGEQPNELWRDEDISIPQFTRERVQRCVPTEETAVDLVALRELLLSELSTRKNVSFTGNHTIDTLEQTNYGFRVSGVNASSEAWEMDGGIVVNCLWENRLYFDQQLGIEINKNWVYRLKHRIMGIPPPHIAALDSFTFVLGAFGDIVNYDNTLSYLSWYPECMSGWSTELTTPASWEQACNGKISIAENREWIRKSLLGLDEYFPGMKDFDVKHVDGGVIFSWGKTDIVDLSSELHQRFNIGIHHQDGYYSIDTGKLTSAPLFADHLQQMLDSK